MALVGEAPVDQNVGETCDRRRAVVTAPPCLPQGRGNDGESLAAQKLRRTDHVAERKDATVAQIAESPRDREHGHDVAEAAAQLPSHQYRGQGPVPIGIKEGA